MEMTRTVWAVNIDDWQTGFVQALEADGCSPLTISAYNQDVEVFRSWWLAETGQDFSPDKITNYDLHAFRRWQVDGCKVAAATWNRRRAALTRFCDWAQACGWLTLNPLDGVQPMEKASLPPRWLDRQEYARLMRQVEQNINAANTPLRRHAARRDAAMVALMVYAGLREFEVTALQTGDVEISERSGRVIIRQGKGGKEAVVPLSREARRLLVPWRADAGQNGRLFDLSTRSVQLRVKSLGDQAGVEELTPHRLRHTCAKRMLDAGVGLERAQAVLRHSSPQTTARYGQPGWSDLTAAVEVI